jgi:hypothetical protein
MWDLLPIRNLMGHWDYQASSNTGGSMTTGDRVILTRRGTVSYVRSGFAFVRWDDGGESSEWAAELERDATPTATRERHGDR